MAFHLRNIMHQILPKQNFSQPRMRYWFRHHRIRQLRSFPCLKHFPEYFKIHGSWLLAEDSRMDCVPVYQDGRVLVVEPRNLKKGDLVVTGRTENCEDGIYVHPDGFGSINQERMCSHSVRTVPERLHFPGIMTNSMICCGMRKSMAAMWCGSWDRHSALILMLEMRFPDW